MVKSCAAFLENHGRMVALLSVSFITCNANGSGRFQFTNLLHQSSDESMVPKAELTLVVYGMLFTSDHLR